MIVTDHAGAVLEVTVDREMSFLMRKKPSPASTDWCMGPKSDYVPTAVSLETASPTNNTIITMSLLFPPAPALRSAAASVLILTNQSRRMVWTPYMTYKW